MTDLADFLLARVADDETRARILTERQRNVWSESVWDSPDSPYPDSPDRILVDCAVKRDLVTLGKYWMNGIDFDGEEILLRLALPYADHPDYREEWRP